MAIGSQGADVVGAFYWCTQHNGVFLWEVSLSVIRESHCGPLDLCTHTHKHTSGYASVGRAQRIHSASTHDLLLPSSTDKAGEALLAGAYHQQWVTTHTRHLFKPCQTTGMLLCPPFSLNEAFMWPLGIFTPDNNQIGIDLDAELKRSWHTHKGFTAVFSGDLVC